MPNTKLSALLLICTVSCFFYSTYAQSPNIIFIIADDLGWKDVGYNGSSFYETPHIDKLSAQGMTFTNAYANAPVCSPSRAAIMSGQYAPRTGHYTNGSPARGESSWRVLILPENHPLAAEKVTVAEALPDQYVSAFVGKWHLGNPPEKGPQAQGFDVNIGGYSSGKPKSYFSPYQNPYLEDGPEGEYLTDRLTNEAVNFIKNNQDTSFFLMLSYHSPHTPIQAKNEDIWHFIPKMSANGHCDPIYAAMIKALDEGVGKVMQTLENLSLDEQTLVLFFSDNGGLHAVTSNYPLRGYKGTLYEGGIRVPMIARWQGHIQPGAYCHEPVMGIDFYPTFLELADAEKPENYSLDGFSLVPLMLQKGEIDREALFWHFPAYLQGGYGGNKPWRTTPVGVVRKGDFKLMEFFEDGHRELYNLKEDIKEQYNLADEMPAKVQELYHLMANWRKSLNAPYPLAKNPDYKPASLPYGKKQGSRIEIYRY